MLPGRLLVFCHFKIHSTVSIFDFPFYTDAVPKIFYVLTVLMAGATLSAGAGMLGIRTERVFGPETPTGGTNIRLRSRNCGTVNSIWRGTAAMVSMSPAPRYTDRGLRRVDGALLSNWRTMTFTPEATRSSGRRPTAWFGFGMSSVPGRPGPHRALRSRFRMTARIHGRILR